MNVVLTAIIQTGAIILAIVLFMSVKPQFSIQLSGIASVVAGVGGLLMYGYGFSMTLDSLLLASIRIILSVAGMFLGSVDFDSISQAPLFQYTWIQTLFWFLHLLAFYATVSAALSTFGVKLLRRLQILFSWWEDLHLIYGVQEKTVEFGKALLKNKPGCLVYITENPTDEHKNTILELGGVLRSDEEALAASEKFLRSIGAVRGKRKIFLYALSEDSQSNLQYAEALLASLKKANVYQEQTSLVIHSREDSPASTLQALDNRYGYGFVTVYQDADLTARMLIKTYPPCNFMTFDKDGRAEQDFEALLIGFGRIGQAVLKNLIMNGQFVGSHFHAAVVSPDCDFVNGSFSNLSEGLLKNYDISFHSFDARSSQMYEYLRKKGDKIRYLVLCTGSAKINLELMEEFSLYFERHDWNIPIFQCSYQKILAYDSGKKYVQEHKVYIPEVLNARNIDEMAMVINHYYLGDGRTTPLKDWMYCDYFSRMSSRASADFLDAMLKMAGVSAESLLTHGWNLTENQLTTLSITEHLRWCAFHFCMGFLPMEQEEYDSRAQTYLEQKNSGQKPLRIGKNMVNRTHACLIPWESLDALSRKEQTITGKPVNYKAMDMENVLIVPKLLSVRQQYENQ